MSYVDLRDLGGEELELWKQAVEEQHDWTTFEKLRDNEPLMIPDHLWCDYVWDFIHDVYSCHDWLDNYIDWDRLGDDMLMDYTEIMVDGTEYWFRAF